VKHEHSLLPYIGQLPTFERSWTEEPTAIEMSAVLAFVEKVSKLKQLGLTGIGVVAN
jgi:hypothetical protein